MLTPREFKRTRAARPRPDLGGDDLADLGPTRWCVGRISTDKHLSIGKAHAVLTKTGLYWPPVVARVGRRPWRCRCGLPYWWPPVLADAVAVRRGGGRPCGWCTGWRPLPLVSVRRGGGRSVAGVRPWPWWPFPWPVAAFRPSAGPLVRRGPFVARGGPFWALPVVGRRGPCWLVCLPFQYWNRAADQWPPSGWAVVGACYALHAWCGWPCRRCWLAQWVARTDTGGPWSLLAGRTDTAAVGGVVRVHWSLVRGGPCWAVWRPCGPSVVSLYLVTLSWPVWALLGAVSLPCVWCPFQFFNERAARGWAVLLVRTGWPCYWLAGRCPCWWSLLVSLQRLAVGRPSIKGPNTSGRRGGLAGGVGGGYSAAVVSLL